MGAFGVVVMQRKASPSSGPLIIGLRAHCDARQAGERRYPTQRVVGVTVQGADTGDTASMVETLIAAAEQVESALPDGPGIEEVVGDKGYHSNDALVDLKSLGLRSYLSEPDRGRRCWKGQPSARDAVYANRRRIRGERGRRLLRCRGELLERPFAHVYETGGSGGRRWSARSRRSSTP